jgi:hypothetical protein
MIDHLHTLIESLSCQVSQYKELLALTGAQRDALAARDAEGIRSALAGTEGLMARIRRCDAWIASALRGLAAGGPLRRIGELQTVLEGENGRMLGELRDELCAVRSMLARENAANGVLAQSSRRYAADMVMILSGTWGNHAGYDMRGEGSAAGIKRFCDRRA